MEKDDIAPTEGEVKTAEEAKADIEDEATEEVETETEAEEEKEE